jgi:uncharacterized protein
VAAGPDFSILKAFLVDPARPKNTFSYHELQGFLFAIASSPELIRPAEWLPMIFDDQDACYASLDEAGVVLGEVMTLYNAINASAMSERPALPDDCTFRPTALGNFADDAPVALWSRGFLAGHDWLTELWDEYVPEEIDEEFGAALVALTFFSSKDLANGYRREFGLPGTLSKAASEIVDLIPEAAAEYAQLGRTIDRARQELASQTASAPAPPVRRTKIGRNEPCPCGSGRKYKMCCGAGN